MILADFTGDTPKVSIVRSCKRKKHTTYLLTSICYPRLRTQRATDKAELRRMIQAEFRHAAAKDRLHKLRLHIWREHPHPETGEPILVNHRQIYGKKPLD